MYVISDVQIANATWGLIFRVFTQILPCHECPGIWLTVWQYWQRQWVGAGWPQTITWAIVDLDPCHKVTLTLDLCDICAYSIQNYFTCTPETQSSIRYANGRLSAISREFSKPWDLCLYFLNRSEVWHARRQQRCDHYNTQSRGFKTARDLTVRRPTA